MSLVKFTQRPITSFFDEFFTPEWPILNNAVTSSVPAVNVQEHEKEYRLSFAVPGKSKSDFEIDLEQDVLSVRSNLEEGVLEKEDHYTRKEFNYQSFKRSFIVPDSVDTAKIKANYVDGILFITLPKRKEALPLPAKRIAIE